MSQIGDDSQDTLSILREVTRLPSESDIHAVVHALLVVLGSLYVIVTPSIAFLSGEGHHLSAVLFVAAGAIVFCVIVRQRRHHRTAVPPRTWLWRRMARLVHKLPPGVRRAVQNILDKWRPPDYVHYPDPDWRTAFARLVQNTWCEALPTGHPVPALFWSNKDSRSAAQVIGHSARPALAVSAGLVALSQTRPDIVRVYLLHEFAHISNGDLDVFAWTMSLIDAFRAIVALTVCAAMMLAWPYLGQGIWTALLLMVGLLWLLSVVVIWTLLARYAGLVISLRELYADVQALAWTDDLAAYRTIISGQPQRGVADRIQHWRSLLTLRLVHLPPAERLRMMSQPGRLIVPRYRYFATAALLCALVQSSPFGVGHGRYWMRVPFLLLWAPLTVAFLWNVLRTFRGMAIVPAAKRWQTTAGLAAAISFMLLLPRLSIPGFYTNVVLSIGDWTGFWRIARDGLSILAAEWNEPSLALVPILSWCGVVWCTYGTSVAAAIHSSTSQFRLLGWIVVAVSGEAILLAISMWDASSPQIQSLQVWLLDYPVVLPLFPVFILILVAGVATFRTHRTSRSNPDTSHLPSRRGYDRPY